VSAEDILTTGVGAAGAVLQEIAARELTLADAAAFMNSVQQILVDLGIEPEIALEASELLEAVAPVLARSVTGGVPDAFPPGGGPSPYRGR
jgi:hypothetical protein